MLRDRAITPLMKNLPILSFLDMVEPKDWQRFEEVSLVLAGLATP
jgi:molybdopterin-containing oxidoreductase family membrane subunit